MGSARVHEIHPQEPSPTRRKSAMPSVIDAPAVVEHGHHDLSEKQPQVHGARGGFWHTMVQYMRRHRVHTSSRTRASGHRAQRQLESPMVRVRRSIRRFICGDSVASITDNTRIDRGGLRSIVAVAVGHGHPPPSCPRLFEKRCRITVTYENTTREVCRIANERPARLL
jgi:hypothetical protein